jgi:uncharacterized small protein (DUF1192 family)
MTEHPQPHPDDWDDEPPTRPNSSAARATVRRIRELEELVAILQARIARIKAGGL